MSGAYTALTVTYGQDLERFALLRTSLREVGLAEEVEHIVIVHTEDRPAFGRFDADRGLTVLPTSEVLPPWMERRRAAAGYRRNHLRHYVRGGHISGWFTQQVAKLATAALAPTEAVLVLDSDMVQIAPLDPAAVVDESGHARLLVDDDMRDDGSLQWNHAAARLLGFATNGLPDEQYIHAPAALNRATVRSLFGHLGRGGRSWQRALLDANVFEYPVYGLWARHGRGHRPPVARPVPIANFTYFEQMWDFRERATLAIREGRTPFLAVQSRLHIPPSSYESVVARAWARRS